MTLRRATGAKYVKRVEEPKTIAPATIKLSHAIELGVKLAPREIKRRYFTHFNPRKQRQGACVLGTAFLGAGIVTPRQVREWRYSIFRDTPMLATKCGVAQEELRLVEHLYDFGGYDRKRCIAWLKERGM